MKFFDLRAEDSLGVDTGEIVRVSSMEEAMELFLSGKFWKLSWNRPNGNRVQLLKKNPGAPESLDFIDLTERSEILHKELKEENKP